MLTAAAVMAIGGCSVHPIPDEVSTVPTEGIVAIARCELRQGLVETVRDQWFPDEDPPVDPNVIDPETVGEHLAELGRRYPHVDIKNDWPEYMGIAVSYDWSFDITEINQLDGNLGFRLPSFRPAPLISLAAASSIWRGKAKEPSRTKTPLKICFQKHGSTSAMTLSAVSSPIRTNPCLGTRI